MVAKLIKTKLEEGAWIRQMFTEGQKLSAKYGREHVFDFSLGNPTLEPPPAFRQTLAKILASEQHGLHRYMDAQGLKEVRSYLAEKLSKEHNLPFTMSHVTLCVGAGGGLNITLKALLNPGDEVVILKPYFPEYTNYIANHGGVVREVSTTRSFQIDFAALEAALSSKTCAVIINSPNNPSGAVYGQEDLKTLSDLLFRKSQNRETPIYLITDEPYAKILFDDAFYPPPIRYYEHTILVTSYSKELGIPGERIGYVALYPTCYEARELSQALSWSQLALGFVNAPALMQRMIPEIGDACVDITPYQNNRDILCDHFEKLGIECVKPQGAFYLFPRTPIADDGVFAMEALREHLVFVPGRAFGVPGHVRISFCFETEMIRRSLKALANVFQYGRERKLHAEAPAF